MIFFVSPYDFLLMIFVVSRDLKLSDCQKCLWRLNPQHESYVVCISMHYIWILSLQNQHEQKRTHDNGTLTLSGWTHTPTSRVILKPVEVVWVFVLKDTWRIWYPIAHRQRVLPTCFCPLFHGTFIQSGELSSIEMYHWLCPSNMITWTLPRKKHMYIIKWC